MFVVVVFMSSPPIFRCNLSHITSIYVSFIDTCMPRYATKCINFLYQPRFSFFLFFFFVSSCDASEFDEVFVCVAAPICYQIKVRWSRNKNCVGHCEMDDLSWSCVMCVGFTFLSRDGGNLVDWKQLVYKRDVALCHWADFAILVDPRLTVIKSNALTANNSQYSLLK